MRKLKFQTEVWQVVVGDRTVIVIADRDDAISYVNDHFKGAPFVLLPVQVFSFKEVKSS